MYLPLNQIFKIIISPDSTLYKLHSDITLQGFIASDARTNDFSEDIPEGLQ